MVANLLPYKSAQSEEHPIILVNNLKLTTLSDYWERYDVLSDFKSIVIPVKRAGKLILLDAIADSVSGALILDTGSAGLVLNSIYFRNGRQKSGSQSAGITGKIEEIKQLQIGKLQFDDVFYENIKADLTDLGHLEQARKTKILGFFGLCMLKDFEVVLDLKNNVIELHRLDDQGVRLSNKPIPAPDLQLPVFNYNNVFFIEGRIANKRLSFCLDTGAESNVLDHYLSDKILNTVTIVKRSTLRGVGEQHTEVFYGLMNDFSLGNQSFASMQTIITSLAKMSESYGIETDGMLGCAFFEQGVFYLNMRNNVLGIIFHKTEKS